MLFLDHVLDNFIITASAPGLEGPGKTHGDDSLVPAGRKGCKEICQNVGRLGAEPGLNPRGGGRAKTLQRPGWSQVPV